MVERKVVVGISSSRVPTTRDSAGRGSLAGQTNTTILVLLDFVFHFWRIPLCPLAVLTGGGAHWHWRLTGRTHWRSMLTGESRRSLAVLAI
jgi:hypothetical protein